MSALCRLCGKRKCVIDLVVELNDESSEPSVSFKNIIERYCHIELDTNKLLPQSVCDECKEFIDKIISFCNTTEAVQIKLKNNQLYNLRECYVKLQEISIHESSKTKKQQTIEELFDDEINRKSELVLHHLNVPVSEGSVNGKITEAGLENISSFRWKNISFKCVECDETAMKSLINLTEHIDKVHNSETPLHCPLCSFGKFTFVHDYMNHITNIHHEHLKLCCIGCSIMFYDVNSLYNHIANKHHKIAKLIVPCLCCGLFLENMSSLRAHRNLHLNDLNSDGVSLHNEIFSSVFTATSESSFNLKLTDRFMNSDGTVKETCKEKFKKWCKIKLSCMDCQESEMDPFQLHLHYFQQHPIRKEIKFCCLECECNVDCIYSFLNHYTEQHENNLSYNCVVCSKLYWNFSSLQLHYMECHPVLKLLICLCCGQVFAKASQLIVHVKQKHNLEVNQRSGLRTRDNSIVKQELEASECDVEEFVGADDDSWDDSELSHQQVFQKPKTKHILHAVIDAATTIDELFFEEINGTSEIPLNHLNVPLNERLEHGRISKNGLRLISELRWKDIDYSCYDCGSSFDTVMDLKNHVRGNHPKSPLMNCSKCKFGEARTIISYLNHLMTKHHEHLRFCCFVCSAIFYDVSALWKHVTQTHKDIADKMIPCLICGQYMETFRMLKAHKVTHVTHENVESYLTYKKNFATQLEENIEDCPYNMALADCDKNADGSVSSSCVKEYSLWNELLLECHECSVDAMLLPEFHLHCERDHGDTIGSKYFCEKCPAESYTRMCSFLYHNISRHDQHLKFCCVTCSQMFWNLTALYRHYRACHPNFKIWMCLICGFHSFSYQRINAHTLSIHGIGKKRQALTPLQKQLKHEKSKTIQDKEKPKKSAIKTPIPLIVRKLKQNRRRTIVPDKLPHNITTTEELFEPELNGTSPHSLIHLNISKKYVAIDGTVTDTGLINISPIRWSDIPYRCAECQDIFGTVISLRDHVYKTHTKTCNLECFICPNGKSRMVHSFVNHVTTKHYEHLKFCCIMCSIMFYDIKTLWKHVYQAHRMKRESISPCLICGTIARTLTYVKQHKMAHLNQETIDSHQEFNTFFAKELNGVMMESKYNLAIPDSDKNADGTVNEEASVKWNKWNDITQICLECPTEPMQLPEYYLHLETNHPELRGQKYTCVECPRKIFSAINAFLIHNINRHGTHLSYCCIVCSQLFWNYTALHRHYRECHPAFNRNICLFCGHHFFKIFQVNEHTTSIHGLKKTADGQVIEMAAVAYKERARIGLKRREKIKSLANDVVLVPVNSDNDDDASIDNDHDTLNVFQNIVLLKQEPVMSEEDEVIDNKDVLIEEILPADIEQSFELLDELINVKIDKSEDDVTMETTENNVTMDKSELSDIDSVSDDKEWDSFSSDDSEEFIPPTKKNRVIKDRILKLPKTIKVVKSFEKLFEEEINGTSSIAQLAHINVRAIYQSDNGEIMPEGLEEIGPQRWQDFTFQCIKCDIKSSSMFDLKEHSKKKHPEVKFPLSCPNCPKSTFNDIASLVNHLSLRHYEHLKFCCLVCSKLFYDIKSLWNHYQLNKVHLKVSNIYPCLCCGTYKVTLKEINLHKLEHTENQIRMEKHREFFAAEYNGVMAESLFNLVLPADDKNEDGSVTKQCEDRYAKWNSMTTYCDVCKQSFCSAFDLYLHYLNVHPEAKQSFKCATCVDKNFVSILRLVSHFHVLHRSYLPYCCIVCSKMFWNFLALHNHYQNCHQCYWICLYCGRLSNDIAGVTAHLRYHKNNVLINGEKKYRCNNCSKIFEHLESYNAHGCPKEKMREVLRKTAKNVSHICEVCGEGFPGPRALENHMLTHIEETKGTNLVECEVCHAKLKNKWTLKQHMVKHSKVKPFKCDICDMSFHHKSTRDRHMMVHTGARPHACLHCDKKFAAKFDLTIHTRLHTGEMNHECTMCDDRYPSWSNLYKHAKSKHNLDIRSDTHKKNSMLLKSDYDSE